MKKILESFDYKNWMEFLSSIFPAIKYQVSLLTLLVSAPVSALIDRVFGIDAYSILALIAVFVLEIVSGIWASMIKKEAFSSRKFSRFTFKCACYIILIAVPYSLMLSYRAHDNTLASGFFEWLHVFLVIHIVVENLISILENISVIQGKDKTYWIDIIKRKVNNL